MCGSGVRHTLGVFGLYRGVSLALDTNRHYTSIYESRTLFSFGCLAFYLPFCLPFSSFSQQSWRILLMVSLSASTADFSQDLSFFTPDFETTMPQFEVSWTFAPMTVFWFIGLIIPCTFACWIWGFLSIAVFSMVT